MNTAAVNDTGIPYGYCHCGCGQTTTIVTHTRVRRGHVVGEPHRYIVGHGGGRPGRADHPLLAREPRFWSKVRIDDSGCWAWTGAVHGGGYGNYWNGERLVPSHRHAYETLVDPIPDGLQIDHLCRNRACVNPEHLEPVTQAENLRRGVGVAGQNARKTHCPAGHEYDMDNTLWDRQGRRCRICRRAAKAAAYLRRKATA